MQLGFTQFCTHSNCYLGLRSLQLCLQTTPKKVTHLCNYEQAVTKYGNPSAIEAVAFVEHGQLNTLGTVASVEHGQLNMLIVLS